MSISTTSRISVFFPRQSNFRTVTSGHLGNSRDEQERTAVELGIPKLSSKIKMDWIVNDESPVSEDREVNFNLICDLLDSVRGNGTTESGGSRDASDREIHLKSAKYLDLHISIDDSKEEIVPINARLNDGILIVKGMPVQFGG